MLSALSSVKYADYILCGDGGRLPLCPLSHKDVARELVLIHLGMNASILVVIHENMLY